MRLQVVGALAPAVSHPGSHLRARDLRKGFGNGAVLDSVSLTVTAGQRLAVIGDNGAGKSTLLRLLAGKLAPDGGEVTCTAGGCSLVEQEMRAPAGMTVGSVRADALRAPREALVALEDAASALTSGAEGTAARYAAALAHAERLAAWDAEWRLEAALHAFRTHLSPDRPLASLSVGQRYRLRLGCALGDPTGAVLLDEPSNHLDDSSLDRLVQWLVNFSGIVVFVTHDRWLLEAAATAIFDLDPASGGGGTLFGGSFQEYRELRTRTLREWRRGYAASLDAERELRERLIIARSAAPGHWQPGKGTAKHGRESRARSAVRSIQRRIDDLRRERGPEPPDALTFTAPGSADAGEAMLLEAAGIIVRGRVTQPPDSPIRLKARSRLLLQGTNGAGKSTLLSVLANQLMPDSGTLSVASGVSVGLLAQEDHWDLDATPADALGAYGHEQIRATGLLRNADLQRRFGQLSVGQRRRAALAGVLLRRPSVLLLDEPTNHLSVTLVDELCDALLSTVAAVVLVTHDRSLRRTIENWPTLTLSPDAAVSASKSVDQMPLPLDAPEPTGAP